MPPTRLPCWHDLTTGDVAGTVARDPVLILPLAAVEQHGPHLPLSTDLDIGMGLLESAFRHLDPAFPAYLLPPQAVGTSMEHRNFPGTLSLPPESLIGIIAQLGESLARSGVRRLVLCNSHGGNRQVMDLAALRLRLEHRLLVVKASYFRLSPPEDLRLPVTELRHGLHGGAVETAMMLHLRPDAVRMDQATTAVSLGQTLERDLSRLGPEGEASFAWLAEDLNASGVVGEAVLATAAMGERLVEHYGAVLADVIREARTFPLAALGGGRE